MFLVALCLSIFLDAIQRFVEPQEVSNPEVVFIVGAVGLLFNIIGLFVFHQHSHGHEHDHAEEDEDHTLFAKDNLSHAEQGRGQHETSTLPDGHHPAHEGHLIPSRTSQDGQRDVSGSPFLNGRHESVTSRRSHRRSASRTHADDIPIHPAYLRNEIIQKARMTEEDEEDIKSGQEDDCGKEESQAASTENTPLLRKKDSPSKYRPSRGSPRKSPHRGSQQAIDHKAHKHAQPRDPASPNAHSHSHEDMNIKGIFFHVLGDALGNVGVMASALIIRQSTSPYRFYCDPAISLLITLIILKSALPLCRDTAKPLLQAVPSHISVDDIRADIEDLPGVRSCHHVHVWALTQSKLIATLDVELDFDFFDRGNKARYMELAKEIKSCLHGHGIHSSTVQPEFCVDRRHGHGGADGTLDCLVGESSRSGSSSSGARTAIQAGDAGASGPEGSVQQRVSISDGCGDGTCLLDCNNACTTGKQCCGPSGSGAATPKGDHRHK